MEWNRKTYLHQRYSWYHRCNPERRYQERSNKEDSLLQLEVPTELTGVDTGILDPRDTYADASEWEEKAKDLAGRFIKNFAKYEGNGSWKSTRIRWTTMYKNYKDNTKLPVFTSTRELFSFPHKL